MIANKDLIVQMKEVGLATLLLNLSTMAFGYFTAKFFGIKGKSQISITIESGIQNGTLAFVIATTILNNVEMGLPTGAYSIWMFYNWRNSYVAFRNQARKFKKRLGNFYKGIKKWLFIILNFFIETFL